MAILFKAAAFFLISISSVYGSPWGRTIQFEEDLKEENIQIEVLDKPPPDGLKGALYINISWTPGKTCKFFTEVFKHHELGISIDVLRKDDSGKIVSQAISWMVPTNKEFQASTTILFDPKSLTEIRFRFGQPDTGIVILFLTEFLKGLPKRGDDTLYSPIDPFGPSAPSINSAEQDRTKRISQED